jgi:hypothetical protein
MASTSAVRASRPCDLAQLRLELVDGVELARDLREVVVGLGKLALLDGGQGDRDLGVLALVLATEQRGGERGGLAGGEGVERLVDAGEQLARTDLVGDTARAVDLGVVDRGDQVELREVARLGRAVDGHERAEPGADTVELVLDVGLAGLLGVDGELEALVGRERDLGADVDLDVDQQVAGEVLLVRPLDDVGLRAAERAEFVLLECLAEEAVEALVDGVLDHGALADALVDDRRWHLALAEPGDVDVLRDVSVRVGDARLELLRRHRDGELDASGAQLLDRGLHVITSPVSGILPQLRTQNGVGATGFEPATSRSQTGRSTKLSYAPDRRQSGQPDRPTSGGRNGLGQSSPDSGRDLCGFPGCSQRKTHAAQTHLRHAVALPGEFVASRRLGDVAQW